MPKLDESALTRGEMRKLNALRKSVGEDLGDGSLYQVATTEEDTSTKTKDGPCSGKDRGSFRITRRPAAEARIVWLYNQAGKAHWWCGAGRGFCNIQEREAGRSCQLISMPGIGAERVGGLVGKSSFTPASMSQFQLGGVEGRLCQGCLPRSLPSKPCSGMWRSRRR